MHPTNDPSRRTAKDTGGAAKARVSGSQRGLKALSTTKEQSRRIAKAAKTRASESQRGLKAWSG